MRFDLSDEQQMLRESAERFVRDTCTIEHRRSVMRSGEGIDRAAWSTYAELGWLALPIAEEAGGLGGSDTDVAVLMMALGRGLVIDPFVSSAVLSGKLLQGSTSDAAAALLEQLATGQAIAAFAHLEPGESAATERPRGTTLTTADGGLSLSGTKMLVLDGGVADQLIVSAADGQGQLALVVVARDAPGVTLSTYPTIDGGLAADIRFESVAVPASALLAAGQSAPALVADAIARADLAWLSLAVGSMEASVQICGDYARERQQFGKAIGSFQALQHLLADMFVAAHQARSALYGALAHVDDAPDARDRAISLAKITIGEGSQLVARNGVQIHGGYGVTDEYAISHHYRRLFVLERLFGDVKFHVERLASLSL